MISCYEHVDAVIAHRNQVALRSDMKDYSYFRKDVTEEITDRLLDINRKFPVTIDLGCWDGQFACNLRGRGGVKTIYECDSSCNQASLLLV
ncbi:SAM-dependent methyltransferase [Blastocystis sp. subtype 4]|uniref:SAM-dependent methyltransferase n=1 Tax=Blastocystis sp. subtype 4 TaxID=944170 RepID=UPI000711A591|nr:SAM-dependent methyltransferase [Blastocystis sp. subtype 4]KNB45087.1 SAM-dependent methyltransferase [Blastocystis sp. subtype 4]|eukprot:XP_014528530.1 SAM-dependent methyltransferase [Blastocystis sp. subtype 4]